MMFSHFKRSKSTDIAAGPELLGWWGGGKLAERGPWNAGIAERL